jgi:hypothetical protein
MLYNIYRKMPIITNTCIGRKHIFAKGCGVHKVGGSLTPTLSSDVKHLTNQINNASTSIPGLGSGPRVNITARSEYKPTGNNVSYGCGLPYGLAQLNFSSKKKPKNVRLSV